MISALITILVLAFTSILFVIPPLEPIIFPFFGVYPDAVWWVIPLVIAVECAAALSAHILGKKVAEKIVKRFYKDKEVSKSHERLDKWGVWGIGLFAATPLPITVAVYYFAAVQFNRRKFLIAFSIGRLFKYSSYVIAIQFLGLQDEINAFVDWFTFWN